MKKCRNGLVSKSTVVVMALMMVIGLIGMPMKVEAATTTYAASFFLLKSGCGRPTGTKSQPSENYISVGSGKIYSRINIADDDAAVAANIYKAPDCSAYLAADEEVVWYSCKKIYGTTYHIDGEIVKKSQPVITVEPQESEIPPAIETSAVEAPVVEAPVVETPTVEAPVVETPSVDTSVVEAPVFEAPLDSAPVDRAKEEQTLVEDVQADLNVVETRKVSLNWNNKLGVNRYGVVEFSASTYNTWTMSDEIKIESDCSYSYESTYSHGSKPTVVVYYYGDGKFLGKSGTLSSSKTTSAVNIPIMDGATVMRIALTNVPDCLKDGITEAFIFYRTGSENGVRTPALTAKAEIPVAETAKEPQKFTSLKDELAYMLEHGDTSEHDISKYGYSVSKVCLTFDEVIEEHSLAYAATGGAYVGVTKNDSKKVLTVWLNEIPDDFDYIYSGMKNVRAELMSMVKPGMTDLDKALLAHDYVARKTKYKSYGKYIDNGFGALVYGYADCSGYSDAYEEVMQMLGIKATYVMGNSNSHGWNAVMLDGQYYLLDVTWDDTRSPIEGKISHKFFLYSEKAFKNIDGNYHSTTYTPATGMTSTKYDKWFVHDIVGDMVYDNGFWYYYDANGTYMRAKLDGSVIEVVR